MVDRLTRWPEAVPLRNCQAEAVTRAFTSAWISRFGIPATLTTDKGRQFGSTLWANGMVERFHRHLKSALATHAQHSSQWVDSLPFVMLGIRAAVKEDLRYSSAELVYGSSIRLPAVFFSSSRVEDPSAVMVHLDAFFQAVRPTPSRPPAQRYWHIPRTLPTATLVFLRVDAHRPFLSPAYEGPYPVTARTEKTITLTRNGKVEVVSIDQVKPAFLSPMDPI
uniref:Integrase catalytic domain-containing protein n=1 Tax=Trichuris muris TaxID=70415 RepID=A0A5S6QS23_TRIMR